MSTAQFLSFPFRLDGAAPALSDRGAHVRELIEQVIFTAPRERVFRPEFGAGATQLVFEPNDTALRELTLGRLSAALTDALQGEVDPQTLTLAVDSEDNHIAITVSYVLAAVGQAESHRFLLRG
jgi:uncharacterized protein